MNPLSHIFSSARIVSLALVLTLCSCHDNDAVFNIDTEEPTSGFCIMPLSMLGEEIPYDSVPGESRAVNPMTVDRENMIKKIAIFQFDQENNLRQLRNGEYYIYHDFTTTTNKSGVRLVNEDNMPELADLLIGTSVPLYTCVVANVDERMIRDILLNGNGTSSRINWLQFQNVSFDLPMATATDVNNPDNNLEFGHLTDIYMFGYYEGIVPASGFTLGLGRVVSRIKFTFLVSEANQAKIPKHARFFAAIRNMSKTGYFYPQTETQPELWTSDVYMLKPSEFDPTSGNPILQFYCGSQLGSWLNEKYNDMPQNTQLLLWCAVDPNEWEQDGDPNNLKPQAQINKHFLEDNIGNAVIINVGNNPGAGDFNIVHNTIYSYTLSMNYEDGSGITVSPVYSFAMVWQVNGPYTDSNGEKKNGWHWDTGENDSNIGMDSNPLKLDLASKAEKSNFVFSKLFNRTWGNENADANQYGIVEYMVRDKRTWTQYALKDEPAAGQSLGEGETAYDFTKLIVSDIDDAHLMIDGATATNGKYTNVEAANVKLLPLSAGQATFKISLDDGYKVPNANGDDYVVGNKSVIVSVDLPEYMFSHTIEPDNAPDAIFETTALSTITSNITYCTVTKKFNGVTVKTLEEVDFTKLEFQSISGVEYNPFNGTIVVPEGKNGYAYLHFRVKEDVAEDNDLHKYNFYDMVLPLTIGNGGGHILQMIWWIPKTAPDTGIEYDDYNNRGQLNTPLKLDLSRKVGLINDNAKAFLLSEIYKSAYVDGSLEYQLYDVTGGNDDYVIKNHSDMNAGNLEFDFSKMVYTLGSGETKIKLEDGKLLPLAPTGSTPARMEVSLPDNPGFKDKSGNPVSIDIVNPKVLVDVVIDDAFDHILTAGSTLNAIATGDNLANYLSGYTFSAKKQYEPYDVHSCTGISANDLVITRVEGPVEGGNRTEASYNSTTGIVSWASNATSGDVIVHFNVKDNPSKTELSTYNYFDLILTIPIKAPNVHYDFGAVWQLDNNGSWNAWEEYRAYGENNPVYIDLDQARVNNSNLELNKLLNTDWNQKENLGYINYILNRQEGQEFGRDFYKLSDNTDLTDGTNAIKYFDNNDNNRRTVIYPNAGYSNDYLRIENVNNNLSLIPLAKPTAGATATFDIKIDDNFNPNSIEGVDGITIDNRTLHVQVNMDEDFRHVMTYSGNLGKIGNGENIMNLLTGKYYNVAKYYGTKEIKSLTWVGFDQFEIDHVDGIEGANYDSSTGVVSWTGLGDYITVHFNVNSSTSNNDLKNYKFHDMTLQVQTKAPNVNYDFAMAWSPDGTKAHGDTPFILTLDEYKATSTQLQLDRLFNYDQNQSVNYGLVDYYLVPQTGTGTEYKLISGSTNLLNNEIHFFENWNTAGKLVYPDPSTYTSEFLLFSDNKLIPIKKPTGNDKATFDIRLPSEYNPNAEGVILDNRTVHVEVNMPEDFSHILTPRGSYNTQLTTGGNKSFNEFFGYNYNFEAIKKYGNVVIKDFFASGNNISVSSSNPSIINISGDNMEISQPKADTNVVLTFTYTLTSEDEKKYLFPNDQVSTSIEITVLGHGLDKFTGENGTMPTGWTLGGTSDTSIFGLDDSGNSTFPKAIKYHTSMGAYLIHSLDSDIENISGSISFTLYAKRYGNNSWQSANLILEVIDVTDSNTVVTNTYNLSENDNPYNVLPINFTKTEGHSYNLKISDSSTNNVDVYIYGYKVESN